MLLTRQAAGGGARTMALTPALGKAQETSSEQVGGEVFLGDRDLASLPSLPQPVQVRQHDVLQHCLDGIGEKSRSRAVLAACSSSRSSDALRLPASWSRMVADAKTMPGAGSRLRIRSAAWAAASPPDTRLCMRWTLASSAALYSQPPGVRVGWRAHGAAPRLSSSGLTPVRLAS